EIFRHAESGRHPASQRIAEALRSRCERSDLLAEGPQGHRRLHRRARGDGSRLTGEGAVADDENSLTGRLMRYANVGTGVGTAVARTPPGRLFGREKGSAVE